MSYRIAKVENLIKHEIGDIFLRYIQGPELGFITVTSVKASPDLRIVKVYFSVLEKEKREAALHKIESNSKFIRSELASRLTIKFVPELKFFLDDTLDYVEKIEGLIKKIHKDDDYKGNE